MTNNKNSQNELQHYGVLGMKWGVRKAEYYDRKASVAEAKEQKAKTRLGKTVYGDRAVEFREAAEAARNRKKQKTLGGKISATVGIKRNASYNRAASQKAANRSKMARTKIGKRFRDTQSFNFSQNAKAWDAGAKAKFGRRYLTALGKHYSQTSKSILSTKELNNGARLVNRIFFGNPVGDLVTIATTDDKK